MTPKYSIGQKVWYLSINKPFSSVVRDIIDLNNGVLYRCSFFLTTAVFRQDELFESYEALMAAQNQKQEQL